MHPAEYKPGQARARHGRGRPVSAQAAASVVLQEDVFYYVTMMNENYAQPDLRAGSEDDIIRGCYYFNSYLRTEYLGYRPETLSKGAQITLLGSGAILTDVIKAAELLAAQGIDATVFSVTSWSELARDGASWQQRS